MKVEIPSPSGFVERRDIATGTIERKGFPDYGAIFTSSDSSSEDDFVTDLILRTFVENVDAPEGERDRFFEILGGYFYNDTRPAKTTKVFGIALNPEFGITEGGSTTLKDNWTSAVPWVEGHPERFSEVGDGNGWTFIVVPESFRLSEQSLIELKDRGVPADIITKLEGLKNREYGSKEEYVGALESVIGKDQYEQYEWHFLNHALEYPHSTFPLRISVDCPEIKSVSVDIDGCESDPEGMRLKRKVTFKLSIDETEPKEWICDFGDGVSESGQGRPPESVDHLYAERPASAPKVCVIGVHPLCKKTCKEVSLSEFETFEKCPECPVITGIEHVLVDEDKNTKSFKFTAVVSSLTQDKFEWDWGDGSPKETTTEPTASHDYKIPTTSTAKYTVTVTSIGPEPCRDSEKTTIEIPPACPDITDIEHVIVGEDKNTKSFKFTAVVSSRTQDRFEWDWGDGSPKETTTEPTASHDYKVPTTSTARYTITVTSTGPENCRDSDKTTIEVSAKKVPKLCFFLPLIIAFLAAATFGTFIVRVAEGPKQVPVLVVLIVLAILTLLATIYWYKKAPCPKPGKCDWLGIGWVVTLAGVLVAFHVKSWAAGIILLVLTGLLFYAFFKKCSVKAKAIVFRLIAGLLAAACVSYLIA